MREYETTTRYVELYGRQNAVFEYDTFIVIPLLWFPHQSVVVTRMAGSCCQLGVWFERSDS